MKNNIKELRADKGWSQETLGNKLGVSRQAINAIERGKHDPSLQLAFFITEVFNLPMTDIFQAEKLISDTK
jgi:putative transcriptional regulator